MCSLTHIETSIHYFIYENNLLKFIPDPKNKGYKGAKALRNCITPILEPICKKQGFVNASVILDWSKIVGGDFANLCQAVKVVFPFGKTVEGCLHVQATSSMASVITYQEPLILQKVNQYYGYQAITKLRIFHKSTLVQKKKIKKNNQALEALPLENFKEIPYDPLKEALANLGKYFKK
ncbi:MAG: DUF721 domain-containing protein [Alphaproteobacteria bacterium]|nr:DUF721 domain-containing protein [Alphaproteobacteria bacterium]